MSLFGSGSNETLNEDREIREQYLASIRDEAFSLVFGVSKLRGDFKENYRKYLDASKGLDKLYRKVIVKISRIRYCSALDSVKNFVERGDLEYSALNWEYNSQRKLKEFYVPRSIEKILKEKNSY